MARSNWDWIAAINPGTFSHRPPAKGWRGTKKDRLRGFYNRAEARRINPLYDGDGNLIVSTKIGRIVSTEDGPRVRAPRQSTRLIAAMVWNPVTNMFTKQMVPVVAK